MLPFLFFNRPVFFNFGQLIHAKGRFYNIIFFFTINLSKPLITMKAYCITAVFAISALWFTACQTGETGQQQTQNTNNQETAASHNGGSVSTNNQQETNNNSQSNEPKYRYVSGISGQLPPVLFQQQVNETKEKNLIDLRTPQEIAETGKIKGAINIDFDAGNVEAQFEKLKKSEPVMVYCAKGGRSHDAYNMLRKMGFTRVMELKGGMDAWLDAGLEVEKTK
ncbi:rhodanese-like domain-containing protein [Sphingobacteriales bacterium UPWRP_1]|nr:hypothetical protein B6N25_12380 [Sphingobacteriales bacterium TSM_CSS]PSJ74129.1 rhodanese-like domain-containing protein [Sphingobacteriales bacterium UPWRP_1]